MLPDIAHQPTVHNPFPQLSKVAVAPFFNLSTEPTLDGRRVALAYFNELQLVPGFEVVPVEVTSGRSGPPYRLARSGRRPAVGPDTQRRCGGGRGGDRLLALLPAADGLQVEWYAANPNFHPIPPGYGLPWGTPEERDIPAPLVFEAEMALAKAQLKTQTPPYEKMSHRPARRPDCRAAAQQDWRPTVKPRRCNSRGRRSGRPAIRQLPTG